MKKLFPVLIFLLTFCWNPAQEKPSNIEKIFQEAIYQHQSGQFSKAIENYSKILELEIDNEVKRQILIKRGLANNSAENYDFAVRDFSEAIKLDSTDMASFIDRGLTYYYMQKLDNAEADFKYVINSDTDKKMTENAKYWLTHIEFNRGNYEKAITYCNQLIDNNKNDTEFYFLRGVAYSNLLNYNKAIENYDKAVEINPDYIEALSNRGVAKINLLTTKGNLKPTKKETKSACEDLKKSYDLGDKTNTEDLIFIYCN